MVFNLSRGDTFRPSYQKLDVLRALVPPGVKFMYLTATANDKIRADVIKHMQTQFMVSIMTEEVRTNIFHQVIIFGPMHNGWISNL